MTFTVTTIANIKTEVRSPGLVDSLEAPIASSSLGVLSSSTLGVSGMESTSLYCPGSSDSVGYDPTKDYSQQAYQYYNRYSYINKSFDT